MAKAAGARRGVLLPVSAPFHCALMKPAQERLRVDLDATEFRDLACPLVNNWQAAEIRTGAQAREGLYQQVPNAVRWAETMRCLAARGVTRCVEVGAGGVLTGLLRGIEPSLIGQRFGEPAEVAALLGETVKIPSQNGHAANGAASPAAAQGERQGQHQPSGASEALTVAVTAMAGAAPSRNLLHVKSGVQGD